MQVAVEPSRVTSAGNAIRSGGESASKRLSVGRSLVHYAPAFIVLLAVMADAMQYADTDLWGHVRFGQIILRTGHLIRHDIFSYSARGAPWIDHEWLSQVVMAAFYNTLGVAGLKLMKFLCAGAIMLLLAADVGETGAAPTAQFAVLIAAAAGLQLQIQFRPQLVDYIFLSAMLALLARWRRRATAPLWLILPMMVLWANLHGGFFIGVVVLGGYAGVLGLQDLWEGRGVRRALRLGALTPFAALVTLINPWGFGEWQIVAHNFQSLITMRYNPEFQSMFYTLHSVFVRGGSIYPFIFPLCIMAALPISFAVTPTLEDLPELAIAVLMTALAFYAIRNMAFAVIACAAPIALRADRAVSRWRVRATGADGGWLRARDSQSSRAPSGVQLIALAAAAVFAIAGGLFSTRLPDYTAYPMGAINFMKKHDLYGNVLCDYKWAVCLLWHEAPRSRVFIDSFELRYPRKVQQEYIDFLRGGAGARRVLAAYPHDFILIDTGSPQFHFMMKQKGWRLVYRDPVAALFARAGSAATRIAGVPIVRVTAPPSVFP